MLTNQRTNEIAVMRSWKFNESCASSFLFLFIIASSISSALPRFGVVISAGITHRWGKTRREPHSHEKSWKAVEAYTRRPFKSLIKFLFPFFPFCSLFNAKSLIRYSIISNNDTKIRAIGQFTMITMYDDIQFDPSSYSLRSTWLAALLLVWSIRADPASHHRSVLCFFRHDDVVKIQKTTQC